MKFKSLVFACFLFSGVSLFLLNCSNADSKKKDYLQNVLHNLNKIKSASYYTSTESWAPGDTSASGIYHHFIKEYDNPADTTIGACFAEFLEEDTAHMTFCYDGQMRAVVYDDEGTIAIDSFRIRPLPFRPVSSPFFNYTKNIIEYALATKDSISLDVEDLKDSIYFRLTIFGDKQVEFFGKAHYMENNPYDDGGTTSKYELWINKSTDLPYRVRREMSHDITVTNCLNPQFNKIKIEDFRASDFFEPGYTIEPFGYGTKSNKVSDLTGTVAPDWSLQDANGNTVALKDLKSKIIMIQFTSVSCGPCRASIPFLKQLRSEYTNENFDFAAIESWSKNANVLKNYQARNNFTYRFLMSTKEVTRSYQIKSVPVFFILDENRVIKSIVTGYGEGSTDKEIRDAINKLIL